MFANNYKKCKLNDTFTARKGKISRFICLIKKINYSFVYIRCRNLYTTMIIRGNK